MRLHRWTSSGACAIAAAVIMLGMAYAGSGVAHAGNACDATATPTLAPPGEIQAAAVAATCTPIATTTATATATQEGPLKTHTPTSTATSLPTTNTPVPQPTKPPATNTPKPSNGNEGVNVKPPNTGSGYSRPSATNSWIIGAGLLLMLFGSGAALVGIRQRR